MLSVTLQIKNPSHNMTGRNPMLKELSLLVTEWNSKSYLEIQNLLKKQVPILIGNVPLSFPPWKKMLEDEQYRDDVNLEEVQVRSLV